jgi:hypothetical protein
VVHVLIITFQVIHLEVSKHDTVAKEEIVHILKQLVHQLFNMLEVLVINTYVDCVLQRTQLKTHVRQICVTKEVIALVVSILAPRVQL